MISYRIQLSIFYTHNMKISSKNPKNPELAGFFGLGFMGWVFCANPARSAGRLWSEEEPPC